ncbi:MAG: chorismate-binding protein [Flavobacteriales bacterium]|nr:MAG: chorismate-binding protein [Flavobacteriales bacterium]
MTRSFRHLLDVCLKRRLTFAAFRAPHGPIELWVQHQPETERISWEALDAMVNRFLVMPFVADPRGPLGIAPDVRILSGSAADADPALTDCLGTNELHQHEQVVPADASSIFTESVDSAKKRMAHGSMAKVVLSRAQQVDLAPEQLPDLFAHALQSSPEVLVALVSLPEHGTWLGASPERLINVSQDRIRVDSLAGTVPVRTFNDEVGAWGSKEREEQAMVTAGVVGAFRATGYTDVNTNGPNVVTAGPVAHLLTTVSAPVGDRSPASLVRELHPTPAVCGTPRSEAMSFILANEPVQRGLYAGFWGPWRSVRDGQLFVNIRCLQHAEGTATIHAGAGITAASDPDKELRETEEKARTWLAPIAALK